MITIIGYGNPLRGDDGIGGIVLEEIKNLISSKDHPLNKDFDKIDFINRQQLDVADTETVSKTDIVIFIDAHFDNSMKDIAIKQIGAPDNIMENTLHISHVLSPEEFMSIVSQLYGSSPIAYLCAIRGYEFSFGAVISNRALEHAYAAVKKIERLLKTLLT